MAKKRDEVLLDELDDRERDESALEREPLSVGEALADARAQASDETRDMLPEPKPGDPDYDWSGHYDTTDLYTHTFPDGTVVAIKPFAAIYSKTWLYKIRQLQTDTDIEFAAIDRAACPTAQEVLMNLDDTEGDPFDDLYKGWLEAGTKNADGDKGLTPGE
ncbi:hypothetical protein BN970_03302 [Mycolicibacterium conceptionense]|uniref:Tail assembly chaperone n=1 Tax=Mycolicibacterium conceptionense TaxID=451644 RepID=A0A0U1DGB9_9MYCO|nr:hypothetical protein [Mycolicibacterium conceptionense]ORV20058.1 hypothetical protein AWB98_29385 [Mycolicibacterium conceptionense]CQD15709.1 hypothetical protein BN970_03302 [Mycolicibacterium conceptionense]